jgi:hypothetical protein
MRAVLDTNVLLSGLFWRGAPHALIAQVRAGALNVVSSPSLLAELAEVINRPNSRLYWTAPTPIPRRCLLTYGGWSRSSIRRRCRHQSAAILRTTWCSRSQPRREWI